MPYGATSNAQSVHNIQVIATTAYNQTEDYGFIYTDNNGSMYLEEDPSAGPGFWASLASAIPVIGGLVTADEGSPNAVVPITQAQLNALPGQIAAKIPGSTTSIKPCFKNVGA